MDFAKTAASRELSPTDDDWMYIRAAAIARKIYLKGNIGVGTFKHLFGKCARIGTASNKHSVACGKIIRYCL